MILRLAIASLRARALTVVLAVLSIDLSVALFLGVEKVRTGAKASFADTISGTDLILGARSGSVQLLLYSVFRSGTPTNTVSWESFESIAARPEVGWVVPVSLGDSHLQFRVMGTTTGYFEHDRYRGRRSLAFDAGQPMEDLFDAVIGADVARTPGYAFGEPLIVSHGLASVSDHDDTPLRVAGILAKTGTPVDRTVVVGLEGQEAIHVDWQGGGRRPGAATPEEVLRQNGDLARDGGASLDHPGPSVGRGAAGTAAGVLPETALLYAALGIARPFVDAAFGLWLPIESSNAREFRMMLAVLAAAALASLLPAWRAYRLSLSDGMMVKT